MKRRSRLVHSRKVRWEETSITVEVDYVVAQAMAGETRVISLGPLVFFCTATGDAWMLDAEDDLALQLAEAGTRLPFEITETPERFAIEWTGTFRIEGERMIFADRSGRVRAIIGYPTREITAALARARQ